METHDEQQYVKFPITDVDTMPGSIISHEEICEPNVLTDDLVESSADQVSGISDAQVAVKILTDQSDDDDDKVYPIYIKEEQHQYTSGDDESMAVEALRQLGGMYPCFEDKKVTCSSCSALFPQSELQKHQQSCVATKLSCTTCGERFERKQDLNNHMVCHQVDRPHACRTCGNLFRSKANLQTHMTQVHQTEKPHKCAICGADFQRPSSLSNHMKIHTYVAGRAIMQSQNNETFKKWPDNISETIASASTVQVQNYDVSPVQWSVPSYNFAEQTSVAGLSGSQEKMDTLQEFTVMPNGEVTQFEYTQQNSMSQQYNLSMNSFGNSEGMVKVETLPFVAENRGRNYVEIEINDVGNKQHTCGQCGANFSRARALASHEKIHGTKSWGIPIECEYCDKQFQDSNHLATHQTTCAKKLMQNNIEQGVPNSKWGKHACPECGKKFTTKQKMFRHQWIHRKKTHTCEICGTQFEKQNQLDEHRLSAHPGDSPFTCSECGKSFVSRQGLWEHGRTHAGSPAHFHCDTCSKTFSSRQGYLIHHRTHTGERPYGCKFCWKAFRDGGTLRKHERIHTGERPHVCPLCSRAFNQKVVLREHVRWVHAAGKNETEFTGPPYPCPLCGALNQDRDELCAHIVKHSDQMIAEAKAKTNNNAPKSKSTKKKTKTPTNTRRKNSTDRLVSAEEQNEALLSIAENPNDVTEDDGTKADEDINETLLLVGADKDMEIDNDMRDLSDGKPCDSSETLIVSGGEDNTIITKIRNSDILHLIQNSKRNETLHLIASGKSNTLHLITKQNEALPVLALPNPQSHDNFSSQIGEIRDAGRGEEVDETGNKGEESLIDEETNEVSVDQVAQYLEQQRRESDEDEEMVCGICGDDFDDKNVLMEHVKIHI